MNSIEKMESITRQRIWLDTMIELLDKSLDNLFVFTKMEGCLRDIMGDRRNDEFILIQKNYVRELNKVKQAEELRQWQESQMIYLYKNHNFRNKSFLAAASQMSPKYRRFSQKQLAEISNSIPHNKVSFRFPSTGTMPITPASDFLSEMFIFSQYRPRDKLSRNLDLLVLRRSHKLFF